MADFFESMCPINYLNLNNYCSDVLLNKTGFCQLVLASLLQDTIENCTDIL